MDQHSSIMRKVKKLNRKGKLIGGNKGLNEKDELVASLMAKCDKSEEEVLKAYDEFHLKHENGSISKEEYTSVATVSKIEALSPFLLFISMKVSQHTQLETLRNF